MQYLRSLTITPNENISSYKFVNGGNGRNRTHAIKGNHTCAYNLQFWISKDLDQSTPMEVWLLKMGIDGTDSKVEGTPDVYTIPDSADEFGDDYLKVMTIEAGYNKASNVIAHRLTGAIVDTMTVHYEQDQEILVTFDGPALFAEMLTAFTSGSLTEASELPFRWGDCDIQYGDAGGAAAFSGITMFEFKIGNKVSGGSFLTNSSGTPRRYPTVWLLGSETDDMREVTGQFTLLLNTDTHNGQDLYEDLYNDATGTATPTEGTVLKDFQITMNQSASQYIRFTLHDVILGTIPSDVIGSGIVKYTIPFTATACVLTHTALGTSSSPTNWVE